MDQEMEEYHELLQIDRNALDENLVEQADIFHRISNEYALAVSRKDEANENLKQTDARLNLEIREQLESDGKKATEKVVESEVLNHKDHIDAANSYLEAKHRADSFAALKDAFQQRSYMLREVIELYISGYFVSESHKTDEASAQAVNYHKQRDKHAHQRKTRSKTDRTT